MQPLPRLRPSVLAFLVAAAAALPAQQGDGLQALAGGPAIDPQDPGAGPANRAWVADPVSVRVRMSYEGTKVNDRERLGLFGLHFDLLDIWSAIPGLYAHVGGYGAAGGGRGGLFTGGFGLGWRYDLGDDLELDANLFFGAGGGGNAPQGSGLMVREALGLEYAVNQRLGLRVEAANIEFPDGDIGGRQVVAGLSWKGRPWIARNDIDAVRAYPATPAPEPSRIRASLSGTSYQPFNQARRTNGRRLTDDIGLIGVRGDWFLDRRFFVTMSVHGALTGDVDGYAQLFGGLGYALPLGWGIDLEGALRLGAGGGGGVDTGGGFLAQPTLGLRANFNPTTSFAIQGGRLYSLNGTFDAEVITAELGFTTNTISYSPGIPGLRVPDGTPLSLWQVEVKNRTYFPAAGTTLKSGQGMKTVHALGLGLAYPLAWDLDFTGEGFGAWAGDIGGYAEGWFGLRLRHGFRRLPGTEGILGVAVGAGGGGGVDVGDGLLFNGRAGLGWLLSPSSALELTLGYTDAYNGGFGAYTVQLGMSYRFALPVAH
ncbi:MAG: hypothetical protein D6702_02970 [Planctomycetota bacterium]|nr:MAG: hypothetical protein D6702_02970 [Planctomycetota bacterium]